MKTTNMTEKTVRQMLNDMGEELERDELVECARLLGWTDPDRQDMDNGEMYSHLCQAVNLTD